MSAKKVLVVILLAVSFCFASGVGYGEIKTDLLGELGVSRMEYLLLKAKVDYMMRNPASFSDINWFYDGGGWSTLLGEWPNGIDSEKKIVVEIRDSRNIFLNKSRVVLLESFKEKLEVVYSFIEYIASYMNTDIVARFYSKGDIPLGYFYQGEYHLWKE